MPTPRYSKGNQEENPTENLVQSVAPKTKVRSILDLVVSKLISRKLLTFGIATWLLFAGNLDSQDWVIIAAIYIGIQGAIDFWKVRYGGSV
jgi:hypothetical protein